jgi:hypothetical protein
MHTGTASSGQAAGFYRIVVEGRLDERWSDWFEGLTIIPQASGQTLLSGPIPDQSALFGILLKIRDLGLSLISVNKQ